MFPRARSNVLFFQEVLVDLEDDDTDIPAAPTCITSGTPSNVVPVGFLDLSSQPHRYSYLDHYRIPATTTSPSLVCTDHIPLLDQPVPTADRKI